MDSTLDGKLMERQLASLDELFSNLAREAGVNPSDPPASIKTFRAPLATIHRLANWRYVAFVGSLAASVGVAAWWWSSSAHTTMAPSDPAPLTQAAPKDAAPTAVALSSDLAQQPQPMTRDLADLRQTVEQLKVKQEQLVGDNENLASQLKASPEEKTLGEEFDAPFTRLDWMSRDRFDLQWHRHTGTWFCLHRGLSLVEALKTIEADGLLHPP